MWAMNKEGGGERREETIISLHLILSRLLTHSLSLTHWHTHWHTPRDD